MKITKANLQNLDEVFELAKKYRLHELDIHWAKENGFLVSNFTKDIYEEYLKETDYFYIAKEKNKLLGFLLAYKNKKIKPEEIVNKIVQKKLKKPFTIIKQICVDPEINKKGIATLLYKHLFTHSTEKIFIASIVTQPSNRASLCFHKKLFFSKYLEVMAPDGLPREVWMYKQSEKITNQKSDVK